MNSFWTMLEIVGTLLFGLRCHSSHYFFFVSQNLEKMALTMTTPTPTHATSFSSAKGSTSDDEIPQCARKKLPDA
jgi:hypothetical protein